MMSNEAVVLLALLRLGGDLRSIDLEDAAVQADAIAAGRFRWRKYKDQINITAVGKALRDAKSKGWTSSSSAKGWMISAEGLAVAEASAGADRPPPRTPLSKQDVARRANERSRMLSEEATRKIKEGRVGEITARDALRYFRLDDYVRGDARRARIERVTMLFANDAELSPIIVQVSALVPDA